MRSEFQRIVTRAQDRQELILQFVTIFARFEFALIKVGCIRDRDDDIVEPAWRRFADALPVVLMDVADADVRDAVSYLYQYPPRRLRKLGPDQVTWLEQTPEHSNSAILQLVKDVRNNLLHGGKVPPLRPDRDVRLLRSSLAVLSFALDLNPRVYEAFCTEPMWVTA
jgi:hypothetical protein